MNEIKVGTRLADFGMGWRGIVVEVDAETGNVKAHVRGPFCDEVFCVGKSWGLWSGWTVLS